MKMYDNEDGEIKFEMMKSERGKKWNIMKVKVIVMIDDG